ncbi:MAG TPA: ATP-binding cassette domain-containing protein [Tepidisphaeraceae bacterium]|nr:ATP-binding cassette domain-containing protein [Tepidisphaeraceae bacterium]
MKSVIELEDVSLVRGEKLILDRVNWAVEAGSCAAILGHNGSGKSTIARILACHLWPTSGKVSVLGQEFGEANLPELRHWVRLVQAAGPYDIEPTLTAREVVLTGFFGTLGLYDAVDAKMEETADGLLERLGLGKLADHTYGTLSSGERVRSLIGRALVARPRLLLLDEPTAGLDLLAREQVLATVQKLAVESDGVAIVMITHHVEELPPATSNVLLLKEGRVEAAGGPADVLRGDILSRAYGCPVSVRQNHGRYYVEVSPQAWGSLL